MRIEAHRDFTSNEQMKKLHFCYATSHKAFWVHQYLYFHGVRLSGELR